MIKVGIVGLGFMGWIHWLAYRKVAGVKVVAICESDVKKRSGDWRGIRGNFGPPGELTDLTGVQAYANIDEMLQQTDADLVDICLPPSLHCSATTAALQSGRHVFCEKPMALSAADCEAMVEAARQAKRHLYVGHVLPFFPEYAVAREIVGSGKYGKLLGGHFRRVISDPQWLKDFYDPQRVGGPMIDLHVHDAHFIRLLFGFPTGVSSRGRTRGSVVSYCQSNFEFADRTQVVSCTAGVIDQQGRPFNHGFELHLERATIQFEFAAFADKGESMPLKILDDQGQVLRPELVQEGDTAPFVAEIREVVRCLQSDRDSEILGGELARDAVLISHLQSAAILNPAKG